MFSTLQKIALALAAAILLTANLLPLKSSPAMAAVPSETPELGNQTASVPTGAVEPAGTEDRQAAERPKGKTVDWRVETGDTLSRIFRANNAPLEDLQEILAADAEYLHLETLKPGTRLVLHFNEQGQFSELILFLDPARHVTYSRQPDGAFVHQAFEEETFWVSEVLRGTINGSFYASAMQAGITQSQILLIDQLLGSQLNFRRDLRAGDRFSVIVGHEMTATESTGKTRIEALSLERSARTHYAFLYDDGNYYDENGESVTPAFLRLPTQKRYRVSSHFNPRRLHPVTGRISPHNGVDLATPTGTPILSTGDGIVARIGNHPYAGKYIDIDHGGSHTTRYLHLHKILVRKGAAIERGQKIALSGNTGRSTGPHLHFEFHINGRPVDPLTADIPTAAAIPETEIASFKRKLHEQRTVMEYAASRSELAMTQGLPEFDET
ncbi:peptidoglycan DD-metalloendopeptidase family protein [Marinobacter nauticus]|uniref:peptidoglycan DD-metalloendopeptidase family protein n=1 Tax=Marinobacter nauticus TaxID=2743 RepID=UPI001C56C395|nr:peptidoglycan DD-metalloendopeptidase family protein [Marinobacter nauticus]MBW3198934.1 peptidoglycan DD-metalloendopeptidase family protein [Marinobacter nauticus]MBY6184344.1 peptidoglycan DD-metalloendopeptidase family protein [Marinobacter nauticus]